MNLNNKFSPQKNILTAQIFSITEIGIQAFQPS
jgi:hypothetical protein